MYIYMYTLDYILNEIPGLLKMMLDSKVVDPPYTICRESTVIQCECLPFLGAPYANGSGFSVDTMDCIIHNT